ncbi:MAG TPA: NADH-quinone oxidoreductase subunit C [Gaiellaceae bacterium]|nr:NADH-quinone oxidoreductase subunit C [Gaiellaceae bacterium]
MSAAAGGAGRGDRAAAGEDQGRCAAGLRDPGRGLLTYEGVPGLVESREALGETTLVVDPPRLVEACTHLRDAEGFNFLADIAAADYLDWGRRGVAGYIGTTAGRDLNRPGSQGLEKTPEPKPKRFAMNYHLLAIPDTRRVRVQVWLDEDEPVSSVVTVWPTADWHEREAWDLMGIRIEGHPNLARILMEDDWEGHPLRKDYPIGGEPVRFSGEE